MAKRMTSEGDDLTRKAREFIAVSKMIDDLTERRDALKSQLSDVVDSTGEGDDKGHRHLILVEPIDGIKGFKRERRVTRTLSLDGANRVLVEAGLVDRCVKMRPEVDQTEVMGCLAEGLLTERDVEEMFPANVTYAFKTLK